MGAFALLASAESPGAAAAEHAAPEVSMGITLLFAGLLVAMVVTLALEEKIHAKKSMITGIYAVICLLLASFLVPLPYEQLHAAGLHMPIYVPGIEWEVIAIILGSSLFVDATSKTGLFTWIAIRLTKASGGDPAKLLIYYGLMTVVFSAVLNNVTAMIIVGSLTVVSLDKLNKRDMLLGFLLIEGLLTNIGGLLTLISSVPNIIVGQAANIEFVEFFIVASPYVVVATAATLWLGMKRFGVAKLATEAERVTARKLVEEFDENDGIESKGAFWSGAALLGLFIVTLATASILPGIKDLGMGFVAISFGAIALLRYKGEVDRFYREVDWDLLLFFVSLFVVIFVMEHARVLALIGMALESVIDMGPNAGSATLLTASAVLSSVTDNIPLAAMLSQSLTELARNGTEIQMVTWWSVAFGANLGGSLTPIGSASTMVAVTIMHRHNLKVSFGGFVKMAAPFALMHIALAVVYVLVRV